MKNGFMVGWPLALASLLVAAPAVAQNPGFFKFQTMFLEAENKCFEGNRFAPDSVLQGAAFMDDCQNVSGQLWMAVPEGNGFFRLKTQFQGDNKCLEGNRFAPDSVLQGGAFMDDCQNVSGQLWQAVPEGNGFFRLKTQFQGDNKCLEGNRFAQDAVLRGAAFMDNCQNVSGQLWKITGGELVNGIPQPSGQPIVSQPAGQTVVQLPGQPVIQQPAGQTVVQIPGQTVVQQPAGQTVVQIPGQTVVQQPAGQTVVQIPGQTVVQQPAGQTVIQIPGQTVVQQPSGQTVIQLPAGQYIIHLPANQYVVQQPGGQVILQQPMGMQVIPQTVVAVPQITGQCHFYEHGAYRGKMWTVPANHRVHWYDQAQQRVNFRSSDRSSFVGQDYFDKDSGANDKVSSAKVDANCKAVLWEDPFENGRMLEIGSDAPDFVALNFNDIASSAECICR